MGMRYLLLQDVKVPFFELKVIIQQLLKHADIPGCQFSTKIAVRKMSLISTFLRGGGGTLIEIISMISIDKFHPERSERMLKDKHRFSPMPSKAHPIDKHTFSHSNQRARCRRRQNFLNHEVTAQPGPWITGKSAPSLNHFMLLWEKPLPVLCLNRDQMTSFKAPVFPREIRKDAQRQAQVFPNAIKSTPHRQAHVFPFKSTCTL